MGIDLIWLAAFVIIVAFLFYALERVPFPATPKWLKSLVEILLALAAAYILAQRAGILH
jgi:hypothetical protein